MSKQVFKNPAHVTLESSEELSDMLWAYKQGVTQVYPRDIIEQEIAFRMLIGEWISEEPSSKDDGCGHDQNESYYE